MAGAIKGRGALSQPPGRFDKLTKTLEHDGWYEEEPPNKLETVVLPEPARSIISRNDSPDIGFGQSINPYRGCEHGCVYCADGTTQILMADGRTRALAEIRVGDSIYGTKRMGWYRRYVTTEVLAHWSVVKPAYRITLEDGTTLITGPDHRFLTERGWKFVTGPAAGNAQRPYLTLNNKLMGTGRFSEGTEKGLDYRRGYLCGIIRGDGLLASYHYRREGRVHGDQHQFRLALCDVEALDRTQRYLTCCQVETRQFTFAPARPGRRVVHAIRTHARAGVDEVRNIIAWPDEPTREWQAGFLAGIFDAEGSYSDGSLRISNSNPEIIAWIVRSLSTLKFRYEIEHVHRVAARPIDVVRLVGGLVEHLRFFHNVDPAINRKRDITGQAVKSEARLKVVSIEPLGKAMRLYDITTGTGDFIANGVVSHNCSPPDSTSKPSSSSKPMPRACCGKSSPRHRIAALPSCWGRIQILTNPSRKHTKSHVRFSRCCWSTSIR
jgi:hypothetical protein